MLDFRQVWLDRIEGGEATGISGNKYMIHLADVLRTVVKQTRLGIDLPLGDLSFKKSEARTRAAVQRRLDQGPIARRGALDGLNAEARAIFWR